MNTMTSRFEAAQFAVHCDYASGLRTIKAFGVEKLLLRAQERKAKLLIKKCKSNLNQFGVGRVSVRESLKTRLIKVTNV